MPVYDYDCRACGVFTALRPMSECKAPLACPVCGVEAGRVFLTVPAIAGMDARKRTAMAVNERSAHEPRSSRQGHGASCSCCSNKASGKSGNTASPRSFPKARPWMISH